MDNINDSKALKAFVRANKCFEISHGKLFCNICNKCLCYSSAQGVKTLKKHERTLKHQECIKINEGQSRLQLLLADTSDEMFHTEFYEALLQSNIPIFKIDNIHFRNFLQKYTGRKLKDESSYRKQTLDKMYLKKRNFVKSEYSDKHLYMLCLMKPQITWVDISLIF